MSAAFVVSRSHIRYLVDAAAYLAQRTRMSFRYTENLVIRPGCDKETKVAIGQDLWNENIKSVQTRYPEDSLDELPGPIGENYTLTADDFPPRPFHDWSLVQILKACDCYAYQTCEHQGWETSRAKTLIDSIISIAYGELPGYDDANWQINEY